MERHHSSEFLVSVAIPAYKAKYLGEAIESVLAQTYQNIELIIVNDASPEPVGSVVNLYTDKRIRYYVNKQNIGGNDPVANWNKCLSYAKGEFFALLCDDDVYSPIFIEEMLRLAEKFQSCSVFKSGVQVLGPNGNIVSHYPENPEWESCADYIVHVSKRERKQTVSEWMYRRKVMMGLGGYEPVPMAWGADYLSVMKFAADGGIASTSKELVSFRRSGENISTRYDKNIAAKLLGTNVYADKLIVLANRLDAREKKQFQSYIENIRTFEWKATMSVAPPRQLLLLRKQIFDAGVPFQVWLGALLKNILKSVK